MSASRFSMYPKGNMSRHQAAMPSSLSRDASYTQYRCKGLRQRVVVCACAQAFAYACMYSHASP